MKRLLIAAVVLCPVLFTHGDTEKPIKCKTFKITFEVTYNDMTLTEAAVTELAMRKQYRDACRVNVRVEETDTQDDNIIIYEFDGNSQSICDPIVLEVTNLGDSL